MAGISKTRVESGDAGPSSKNMRTGANPTGGAGSNPRAQKPVKGSENSATFKESKASRVTRPVTGSK